MSCIPPCDHGDQEQSAAKTPYVDNGPHFANVWFDALRQSLQAGFMNPDAVYYADRVIARYKEIYTGA